MKRLGAPLTPFWPKHRLNPERPTVWFVGVDDEGNVDRVELDLLPEGQPYMLPAWWTQRFGPFTRADADRVIDRILAQQRDRRHREQARYLERIDSDSGDVSGIDDARATDAETRAAREARQLTPPTIDDPAGLLGYIDRGRQWRCASEIGARVRTWTEAAALMRRVQGRHRMFGLRIRARITCAKIDRNTWLLNPGTDEFFVQYHRTVIIVYHPNGQITLNTGGMSTPSTKTRLNRFIPPQWSIGTIRTSRRQREEGRVHTVSGFTGRASRGTHWVVFFRDNRGSTPYAPYHDGLVLPAT